MPDRRKHRGPHPEDARLFDERALPRLRAAAADFCWLLSHHYPHTSSLKLVGDRYELLARQRIAVSRCCCSDAVATQRQSREASSEQMAGRVLWIDGYNALTTIEAALAGGVILAARDGTYRDMASMHGSYRRVAETRPALELLGQTIAALGVAECRWYLDQPVSNSGRLKKIIEESAASHGWTWQANLVPDPDAVLAHPPAGIIVATADSAILDCGPVWFNLARRTITQQVPDAWIVYVTD
jgi:hypothetical protein